MIRPPIVRATVLVAVLAACSAFGADQGPVNQGSVKVEPSVLQGPRPLAKQTETAVVRDYLEAWQSLSAALEQNRTELLSQDFVGTARDKFAQTIEEQAKLGIRTRYQERSHDIRIVFYSPDGLSIQLVDNIEYQVQLLDHEKTQTTQVIRARYVAVLTPAEVRWRVRVLQTDSQ
jgi:hypothetical protein